MRLTRIIGWALILFGALAVVLGGDSQGVMNLGFTLVLLSLMIQIDTQR